MTAPIVNELQQIPMSPTLAATVQRASNYAAAQSHVEVTLEHLLLALTEDDDASVILAANTVDTTSLKSEVSIHLGRMENRHAHGQSIAPRASADLNRILGAATEAAKGRRNEINGAIVLAAIVGDGKSTAAHLLEAQGLTFEDAIRVLQSTSSISDNNSGSSNKIPSAQDNHAFGGSSSTDDILARARNRVATRTGTAGRPASPSTPTVEESESDTSLSDVESAYFEKANPAKEQSEPQSSEPTVGSADFSTPTSPPQTQPKQPPHAPPPMPGPGQQAQSDQTRTNHHGANQRIGAAPREDNAQAPAPTSTWPTNRQPPSPPAPAAPANQPNRPPPPPLPFGTRPQTARPQPPPAEPKQGPVPQPAAPNRPFGTPNAPTPTPAGNAQPGLRTGPQRPHAQPQGAPQQPRPAPQARPPLQRNEPSLTGGLSTTTTAQRPLPTTAARKKTRAQAPNIEAGQMVENIPRNMRVAVPSLVEIRIAKAHVPSVGSSMQGSSSTFRHELLVTNAMSVRLRAPDGGFFIETASPETQWIENTLGMDSDDYASWRWTVTPKETGKKRLHVIVSARTVGIDGLAAESALPDRVFEIRVRTNYSKTFKTALGWTAAAVIGGLFARFGEQIWVYGSKIVQAFSSAL